MRGIAYVIAAIAAVGIMIAIASRPVADKSVGSAEVTQTSSAPMAEAGTLTMAVPEMHCGFSCFPRVKKALESDSMVQSVELVPQKEEGVLDDRKVIVHYKAGFSATDALAMLNKEGFTDSEVVQ